MELREWEYRWSTNDHPWHQPIKEELALDILFGLYEYFRFSLKEYGRITPKWEWEGS